MLISDSEKKRVFRCPLCRIELKNYKDADISELKKKYESNQQETSINMPSDQDVMSLDSEIGPINNAMRNFPEQMPLIARVIRDEQQERKDKHLRCNIAAAFVMISMIVCIVVFVNGHEDSEHQYTSNNKNNNTKT